MDEFQKDRSNHHKRNSKNKKYSDEPRFAGDKKMKIAKRTLYQMIEDEEAENSLKEFLN